MPSLLASLLANRLRTGGKSRMVKKLINPDFS